ncbi:TrmB family transcriptional regulator [Candidatus Woesearchaeota archaeon]|nr:TrmB family transcriptional regulator [Candidatus Woesearchaeota archaeon]
MIVQEEFLKKLRSAFDLNIYEVKIWTALLSRGLATAGELSDISNVPRSRSYDVLESLEKKGFVIMKLGKPIKYIAVQPQEIVKRVKRSIQINADDQIKSYDNIKDSSLFNELELLYKQGIEFVESTDLSGAIRGRDAIYNHMESMMEQAEKSIVIVTTEEGFIRKVANFSETFKRIKANNVKIRIAAPLNKDSKKLLKDIKDYAEVKTISNMNARFIIIDGKDILFMINNDKEVHESYDVGIWVNTPFFASALENLFNISWKRLETIKAE